MQVGAIDAEQSGWSDRMYGNCLQFMRAYERSEERLRNRNVRRFRPIPGGTVEERNDAFMGVRNLNDEQLMRRANNAGRNLAVLATLAICGALGLWAITFIGKGPQLWLIAPALALSLLGAGYLMLTIAAFRGNPQSITVVLVLMLFQLAVTLVWTGISASRTGTDFAANFNATQLVIPILVLCALGSSRSVLLELQNRGLTARAFPAGRPSRALCFFGGTLLATALVFIDSGSGYAAWKIDKVRAEENLTARKFVQLLRIEDKDFMAAAAEVVRLNLNRPANASDALAKADVLEKNLEALRKETGADSSLATILTTYGNAVRAYKSALLVYKDPKGDEKHARELMELGDKRRVEAGKELQQRFGSATGH